MSGFSESFDEAWQQRFGVPAKEAVSAVHPFLLHRSVRKYLDRPVSEEIVEGLMGAAVSASTSSNLQMWSAVSVQDAERRKTIAHLCGDQYQVLNAPWFFAFLADHHRIRAAAAKVGEEAAGLGYTEFLVMAIIDAALAAERFACAAESMGLGVCYIGGLRNHPDGVKELLGLPEGTFGVFGLCLGWPAEPIEAHIKPRLHPNSVWFRERYEPEAEVNEYNARMSTFYESEGMRGETTWSMRSGRRVDRHHLTGREVLKGWLEEQGMGVE